MIVHVAMIEHRHGTNFYVAKSNRISERCDFLTTAERLQAALYQYTVDWWHEAVGEEPDLPEDPPRNKAKAIKMYFRAMQDRGEFITEEGKTEVLE